MKELISQEGYIHVTGGRVWYRVVGSGKAAATPLLILHGGPGFPHDYLEPLEALADERQVIWYDQLGCGKSDRPEDSGLWNLERFVEEVGQVQQLLQLNRVHLLGHSWGTLLATEYALANPSKIASVILASPILSIPRWTQDQIFLLDALPCDVQVKIYRHEVLGTIESEDYQVAVQEYHRRHGCRLDPSPEVFQRAAQGSSTAAAEKLLSRGQFIMTGDLKDFDRTPFLKQLTMPSLITCGRYDFATPAAGAWYQSLIPKAEMRIFENSTHSAHLEETDLFLSVVRDFLHRVDNQT